MFDTSKIRCKALCVALAVAVATFGVLPKTGTSLDDFTQPEEAEAIPIVAVPIAVTLFSLAGIAVVGSTQSEYDLNLEKCWNDFVRWSGTTSDALAAELNNAVGDDGMLMLSLLSSGFLSNLDTWANVLGASEVESSAVNPFTVVEIDGETLSFRVTDVDLSMGATSNYPIMATYPSISYEGTWLATCVTNGMLGLTYGRTDGLYRIEKIGSGGTYSLKPGDSAWNLTSSYFDNRYYLDDLTELSVSSDAKIKFQFGDSVKTMGVLDLATGQWTDGVGSVSGGKVLDGAVAGALVGSVLAGGRTWGDFADKVKVWSPTADQLAAGYDYTDVMEGTGALENSSGGEGEGGDADIGSLLNKILAALTLLLGLDRIPAILDGISSALAGWWDDLMAWCADVWAWMQSLDMAQWLSDVWDWLRNVDLVSLLSPLSLLWEWLSSLGLAGWLADVWTWIQSLGLVQWLAQVWDWIATLDIAGEFAGLLAAIQALPDFFKPRDDFDWSKFKDVDAYMIFPICLPWDLYDMVSLLSSSARAPAFEFPLVTPVGDYSLSVDLSDYDSVASILRTVELLLFGIGLIFVTKKMMG